MGFAKTYSEAKAQFKPMARTEIGRGTKQMNRSSKRLGPGKKTKAWNNARAVIKRQFAKAGITTCELRGSAKVQHECGVDNYLGFAHSKKRRHIIGDELFEVALLCLSAHEIVERMSEGEMTAIIREIIATRNVRM